MYVVRDIFRCKPGHSKSVAEKLKNSFPLRNEYASSQEMREAVKGYMDEVDGGYREVFRIL